MFNLFLCFNYCEKFCINILIMMSKIFLNYDGIFLVYMFRILLYILLCCFYFQVIEINFKKIYECI